MHLITSFQFTRSTIETNSMRSQHFFGHSLLNIGNIEWNKQSRNCWWKKKLIKFYKNEVIVLIKETIKRNQRSHAQFQRFADHCTFSFTLLGAQKMFKIQLIIAALIWCRSITTAKKCERDEEKKLYVGISIWLCICMQTLSFLRDLERQLHWIAVAGSTL